MIIGQTLNGAIRTTYLRVTLPFSTAMRMLYRGARGVIAAAGRLGAQISAWVLFGILAPVRGIRWVFRLAGSAIAWLLRSVVFLATSVGRSIWNGIVAGIRAVNRIFLSTVHMIGPAIASVFRFAVTVSSTVLRSIRDGILSALRAIRRSIVWTWSVIVAVAIMPFRLAAMSYVAMRRSTGRVSRGLAAFIGARYRAFVFGLATTSMTLSLEDSDARLLVLKGNRVIAWRSGQIAEPPEVEAGTGDEAPAFNPLGSLLEGLPARSKRVVAALPLHVPLLRHIPLPDVKGRYLREIVSAEVLNSVPFSQDEIDIQWRVEQGDNLREASVIAIPRDRMNGQIKILRNSQLAPSAIYSKATSLAVAVGRADVFILHMTRAQTAVILVRGGVTRIVHRLELPADINDQAEAISMGVGQVAGYHRSQRPDDDVSNLPVVVTGELDQVGELVGLLATTLGRPIHPFEPDLECPEGFSSAEFASNIGLYLASRSKKSAKMISAQNVLPERHRPKSLPVAPVAVFAGLLLLGFLAFNFSGWVSNVSAEQGLLNARLDIREDQAREFRLALARQNIVGQRIADADSEAVDLKADLVSFGQEMETLLFRLSDITGHAQSSNVELTRLVPIPEGFSVSGSADSYSDVLGYTASLRSSPNFEDATVLQVADSTAERLAFTVIVIIAESESDEGEGSDTPSP
ncbi:MAG: hypothetical protein J4N86_00430 [Chloroflexi bacterium]|nr:hypothetical protein [Chloroflexota bacterium]